MQLWHVIHLDTWMFFLHYNANIQCNLNVSVDEQITSHWKFFDHAVSLYTKVKIFNDYSTKYEINWYMHEAYKTIYHDNFLSNLNKIQVSIVILFGEQA